MCFPVRSVGCACMGRILFTSLLLLLGLASPLRATTERVERRDVHPSSLDLSSGIVPSVPGWSVTRNYLPFHFLG
jgi:hypothetical protein